MLDANDEEAPRPEPGATSAEKNISIPLEKFISCKEVIAIS